MSPQIKHESTNERIILGAHMSPQIKHESTNERIILAAGFHMSPPMKDNY